MDRPAAATAPLARRGRCSSAAASMCWATSAMNAARKPMAKRASIAPICCCVKCPSPSANGYHQMHGAGQVRSGQGSMQEYLRPCLGTCAPLAPPCCRTAPATNRGTDPPQISHPERYAPSRSWGRLLPRPREPRNERPSPVVRGHGHGARRRSITSHHITSHRIVLMAYRTAPTAEGTDIVRVRRRKEEVLDLFDGQSPVHVEVDGVDDQVHLARWVGSKSSQRLEEYDAMPIARRAAVP